LLRQVALGIGEHLYELFERGVEPRILVAAQDDLLGEQGGDRVYAINTPREDDTPLVRQRLSASAIAPVARKMQVASSPR
jgi:hypothetical protein